ncbi:hypothetical protein HanRHA438_Chr11g0517461 [Helianthus annuus]|nr:hypothetical protein HanRHA438_Chr11g0517461 [Helianthus annuus]
MQLTKHHQQLKFRHHQQQKFRHHQQLKFHHHQQLKFRHHQVSRVSSTPGLTRTLVKHSLHVHSKQFNVLKPRLHVNMALIYHHMTSS